ncbi:predicted protein [Naegleria gruberi]|uniref:Predicted protein n=1 Tax=Naegleria gruberi TaxID=5762 RepID=D2UZQ8_NAEGR|nr:uncharacterized protein NAEGRDRAFT_45532 [Naegleria gruberi]EFC49979.1 predicted protein [Naegleria gruberi]|eukprot:XP_002682723.1 predicted protein [Naegleria gruberi strain NEG-M]
MANKNNKKEKTIVEKVEEQVVDDASSSSSEEEIPQEEIDEKQIIDKVESTLEDDPLNRIKKSNDEDLDDKDKFLKSFLFKQGWIFDYEKNGDRYKQQAHDLDKGDMLDDQFNELDIESQRINLENSKIGTNLPEKQVEEDNEEEEEEEEEPKESEEIKNIEPTSTSTPSEKTEKSDSESENSESDDASSDSDEDSDSSDDKKEHKSERERKDSKKKRKRKAKNEKIKEQIESVKKEYNEKAEKIKKEILELVFKLKDLIKGDGSIVDKLKISKNDDVDQVWELVEKKKVIEEFAKSEAEEDDDDFMEDDEGDANLDSPIKIKRKINRLFENYYDSFFEDVNAATGDTYKFKYKNVDKTSCGLSVDDILNLEDDDLDKIVPIKHLVRYDYKEPDNKIKKDIHFKLKEIKTEKGLLKKKDERALRFKTGSFTGSGIKDKKKNNNQKDETEKKNPKSNNNRQNKKDRNEGDSSEQTRQHNNKHEKKPRQDKKRKQQETSTTPSETKDSTKQPMLKKKKVDISKFADKDSYSQEKDYVPMKNTNVPKKPKQQPIVEKPVVVPISEATTTSEQNPDMKKKRKRGKGGKKKGNTNAVETSEE